MGSSRSAASPERGGLDAVVVGSGPNGLAAAVAMAQQGASVLVLEARDEIGGGTRTRELTLPGFHHDVCSGCHPMGVLSPFFRTLPLGAHGLRWVKPTASVAHPLDGEPAVVLRRSPTDTARGLGSDARAYERMVAPFLGNPEGLLQDVLAPLLRVPKHPLLMLRFGLSAVRSAVGLARGRFAGLRARALFAGCAAHAILPLDRALTAAMGLLFCIVGHVEEWPVAAGGSVAIARALASVLASLGGRLETGRAVRSLADLPPTRVVLFDTSPAQMADIAGPVLPASYVRALRRYRYGPGVFKIDWALDGPIPWRDPAVLEASTVHVGGTLDEIAAAEAAVWRGEHPEQPFVLLVQQSQFDPTRAPAGKHTGYAYCHVPAGSAADLTQIIERQVERFAPAFRDRILARHVMSAADFERYNPSFVGGAITGGVADLAQVLARPVARYNPYATPNPRVFLCSGSTPPGGGVHGMCGYHAARAALRRMERFAVGSLLGPA
ncbi:MAG TPA: NAD(P)/FAD-dependent oxidoreductase [Polyangiaceae bacterium]|jgi:phytoene dehydrogenase-like protein|nr:NAD(P)/FAD-dependent oxidoreductase [Polyangiaceae bacterium]